MRDGFVMRYDTRASSDGLAGSEGAFLARSFWLADNLVLLGRRDDARRLFQRLLALRNDVGLLSEEYDPRAERLVGNFPRALSHIAPHQYRLQSEPDQAGPARPPSNDQAAPQIKRKSLSQTSRANGPTYRGAISMFGQVLIPAGRQTHKRSST